MLSRIPAQPRAPRCRALLSPASSRCSPRLSRYAPTAPTITPGSPRSPPETAGCIASRRPTYRTTAGPAGLCIRCVIPDQWIATWWTHLQDIGWGLTPRLGGIDDRWTIGNAHADADDPIGPPLLLNVLAAPNQRINDGESPWQSPDGF